MPAKFGIGVIGCGARIRTVLEHTLAHEPRLQVVAACDPRPDSVDALRQCVGPSFTVYDDYQALVNDPAVQWVFVGSWNVQHHDHIVAALNAGCHVFAEKPLATTIEDCLAIYEAHRRAGSKFFIGFPFRCSPHCRRIHDLIRQGAIGDIVSIEANETLPLNHGGFIMADWRRHTSASGGHLLEKCCHDIDVLNWYTGSRARAVAAFGGNRVFRPENADLLDRMGTVNGGKSVYLSRPLHQPANPFTGDHDIVDHQVAIIEFENHVRCTFHTNIHSDLAERRTYICGTLGSIRADVLHGTIEYRRHGVEGETEQHGTGVDGGHGPSDVVLGQELADCIVGNGTPAADLEAGLASAITCLSIDQAMHEQRVVDISPIWARIGQQQTVEQ